MNDGNGVSRKTTAAAVAISAIAASDNLNAQVCITIVAAVAIIVQGVLDHLKKGN